MKTDFFSKLLNKIHFHNADWALISLSFRFLWLDWAVQATFRSSYVHTTTVMGKTDALTKLSRIQSVILRIFAEKHCCSQCAVSKYINGKLSGSETCDTKTRQMTGALRALTRKIYSKSWGSITRSGLRSTVHGHLQEAFVTSSCSWTRDFKGILPVA